MKKSHELGNNTDISAIRAKLQNLRGKAYWRSLEELAETEEFQRLVENEFPQSPMVWEKPFSRRKFMQLMGASLALAGLTACTRQPLEKIVPYVKAPEEIVPGKPLFFASAFTLNGYASGILVESHMGRPTKIEGNPQHPASLGATSVLAQASILDLYDPDRAQVVTNIGSISTWENFVTVLNQQLDSQRLTDGAGIRILTETVTSPTLTDQIQSILQKFALAKWHQYEPCNGDNLKKGAQLAFGEFVDCRYDYEAADYILTLDADFLAAGPGQLKYARQFTARRKSTENQPDMNRLYAVESTPSLTGAMADHRLPLQTSEIVDLAIALSRELEVLEALDLQIAEGYSPPASERSWRNWMKAAAKDLRRHPGKSLIVVGESQPPPVHLLAHVLNRALGNVGKTVFYSEPVESNPTIQLDSLRQLNDEMANGAVEVLLILGGNPVLTAPADFNITEQMAKVKFSVHLSQQEDETSHWCHWHIPQTHYLENWSDVRAFDGTVTIQQPLIAPLYGGISEHELLAVLTGQTGKSAHDIVKDTWRARMALPEFENFWRTSLHDGVVAGTAIEPKSVPLRIQNKTLEIESISKSMSTDSDFEMVFKPDPNIHDGRFANNPWLQELPKPLTKLTWDNAALISPADAERRRLSNGDVVELQAGEHKLKAPVWILPGQAERSITLHFGYGRKRAGMIGSAVGVDVFKLRTSSATWFATGVKMQKTHDKVKLASTQMHHNMENRHLVRSANLHEFIEQPELFHEMGHDPDPDLTLYPDYEYEGNSWGMVVDLNSCIGCNACTVACQSENNIPVVGKDEVLRGREMHWIRIDRYFEGELENPAVHHQPVMCMHCENAPCEVVCPVAATVHSDEGLNEMVYNRCVGTRYCSNNCPYKVRRFNFFLYADLETPTLKLQRNPDVTVRTRGIMEKCTYCVQRINSARIEAKKEERDIRDGEIITACQQVCPTDAIVFGNINDPESRVAQLKADKRNYGILTDLNTRPRTSYLGKLKNPNPELEES